MALESHIKKRRGTEAWEKCQTGVIDVMKKTLGKPLFYKLEVHHNHLQNP